MACTSYRDRSRHYFAGGKKMKTVFNSVCRGLLLIAIGVVFFLINYGYLSWNLWLYAVDLWPLILILAGIGLLFSRRIPISAVLLVFLLCMVGYSMVMGDKPVPGQMNHLFDAGTTETKPINVPLPSEVKKAKVNLKLGGAQVKIRGLEYGESQGQFMTGNYQRKAQSFNQGSNGSIVTTQQSGDTLTTTVSFGTNTGKINLGKSDRSGLELNLSRKVNYDLDMSAGAINGTIDLSGLLVDNLKISTGASNFKLEFSDAGITTHGKIDSGASKLTLVVPENIGVTIRLNGVAASTNFMGSGLLLDDKDWVSPHYADALTKINLEISMAAGSVQLERTKNNIQ